VDNSGQRYGSAVESPPELQLPRTDPGDELMEIQFDRVVFGKLRLLWEERKFLTRALGLGLVLSIILAYLIPVKFQSTTRLMPPDNQNSLAALAMLGTGGSSSGAGSTGLGLAASLLGGKTTGALFGGVLLSRTVEDRLIDRFDLLKVYGRKLKQEARKDLEKNTDISEDRKTGILTITVTADTKERARDLASGYVEELGRRMTEVSTNSAHRERVFLEDHLKVVKKELDQSALEFSAFATKNTAINIPEQVKATMTAAARVQGELAAAESELHGLEQVYTDNNVRVRSLRARIEELHKQVQTRTQNTNGGEDSLGQIIRDLPRLGVTWTELYRRAMINEAVYEALTKQYEYSKVQEAKEVPPVSVLDAANLPEKKSSPIRWIVVLVGLMFSFAIGSGWIIGKNSWNRMDPADERKRMAQEIWEQSTARLRVGRHRA
jgi:capsule polysaccharide export protein KpsE/RkpR